MVSAGIVRRELVKELFPEKLFQLFLMVGRDKLKSITGREFHRLVWFQTRFLQL